MTIRMRSLKEGLQIAGRRMKLGQEFDVVGESHKRVLVAIKAAELAPPAVTVVPAVVPQVITRTYARKDIVAEPPVLTDEVKPKITRKYTRRDMTAEE